MGWWSEEKDGQELLIGDGPLDIAYTMLRKISKDYKRDAERKPTVAEMAFTLESALHADADVLFDGMEELEITEVVIKLKKRPKRRKVTLGDYFAIPLNVGGYAFGRVTDIYPRFGMLFDLLGLHSETMPGIPEAQNTPILRDFITDFDSLEDHSWPTLGNIPLDNPPPKRNAKQASDAANAQIDRFMRIAGSIAVIPYIEEALREAGILA